MPREKELFRDNLVRLDAVFPDKEVLSKGDVIKYTGLTYKVVSNLFVFTENRISKVKLASLLS